VKAFRNTRYQFAWQSTFAQMWAAAYYRRKQQEGRRHRRAVRALANRWGRIIHALWLKQKGYVTATFLRVQEIHASQVA
jgi:hypothetical protein